MPIIKQLSYSKQTQAAQLFRALLMNFMLLSDEALHINLGMPNVIPALLTAMF